MNKIILIILLLIISKTTYSQTKTNPIETQTSFNGRHCRGTSAQPCTITLTNKKNNANTTLYLNNNGELVMQINTTKINETTKQKIIPTTNKTDTNNTYQLQDTFVLDDAIRIALKLPIGIGEIPKGNYPITTTKNSISITFKLR